MTNLRSISSILSETSICWVFDVSAISSSTSSWCAAQRFSKVSNLTLNGCVKRGERENRKDVKKDPVRETHSAGD